MATKNSSEDVGQEEVFVDISDPSAELGIDPAVLIGTLENGLRYYVRTNHKPQRRSELCLAVNVGSLVEEDHERGVAHIVEHLAFRATNNYSEAFELVRNLETFGIKFGACQNAYTSFDETVYQLEVPTDDKSLLEKSLRVLHEWATGVRASEEDMNAERSIILNEWRQGKMSDGRIDEAYIKALFEGSRYAERLPIGTEDIIRHGSPDLAFKFYKRWYRSDNMAVIAVGDFDDAEAVVDLIKSIFESKPTTDPPPPRVHSSFPPHTIPRVCIFEDDEETKASVSIDCKREQTVTRTIGDARIGLQELLFHDALSQRLSRLSLSANSPFYTADSSTQDHFSGVESFQLEAGHVEGSGMLALRTLIIETERVKQHGFTKTEIDLAKSRILANLEAMYIERDQQDSASLADEFVKHFLREQPILSVTKQVALGQQLITSITAEEIQKCADYFKPQNNCVVSLVRPRNIWRKWLPFFTYDTEKDLQTVVEEWEHIGALEPWIQPVVPNKLLLEPPEDQWGHIVSKRVLDGEIAGEEFKLSNGLTILLRQTKHFDDEIAIEAMARGGLTQLPADRLLEGLVATFIAGELGQFGMPTADYLDFLSDKKISISTQISTYRRSISAACSPRDFVTVLQLLHSLFVNVLVPEEDKLKLLLKRLREYIINSSRDPQTVFENRCSYINTNANMYFKPPSLQDLAKLSITNTCQFYRQCFSNPAEFTFVFSGNMDSFDKVLPLILCYLGSIPPADGIVKPALGSDLPERPVVDLNIIPPPQNLIEQVHVPMIHPMCITKVTFFPDIPTDMQFFHRRANLLTFVSSMLETRLLERLRFILGSVYNVNVAASFTLVSPLINANAPVSLYIQFTSAPGDAETLNQAVLDEIQVLKRQGPTQDQVKAVVETERRLHETEQQHNKYWTAVLCQNYYSRRYNVSNDIVQTYGEHESVRQHLSKTLTPDQFKEAFNLFFPDDARHTIITLIPVPATSQTPFIIAGAVVTVLAILGGVWWRSRAH